MHLFDLGLFPYMVEFTRSLLKSQGGNALIEKMDAKFEATHHFMDLKFFIMG